jgi:putative MATE family efflux protein
MADPIHVAALGGKEPLLAEELRVLGGLVVPIVASTFLQVFMGIVDLIIVGHLGSEELAASALGNMWFNCLWFVCSGALSAVDTLVAQAHGARQNKEVSAIVWRGCIVSSVLSVFVIAGLSEGEWVMLSILGVDPHIAKLVGIYDNGLIYGLWPFALFTVLQKYLQATGKAHVPVRTSAIANVFNAIIGYLLVYRSPLRFSGAALATSLSRIFMFLELLFHVVAAQSQESSHGLFRASVDKVFHPQGMRDFVRLAIPGAFMMSLEAWAFDASTLMVGLLHQTTALSAHSAASNLGGLAYFALPFGVGIACSIRIGHLLGAGCGSHARLCFLISMTLGCSFMVFVSLVFIIFADRLGYIFSQDPQVVHCMAGLVPLLALYLVFDGFQGVASGAMRGMGRQQAAAVLNFVGFWVVGIPSGYFLCFVEGLGLVGIWWGTCIGLFILSIGQSAVLARNTDWDALAAEIEQRLQLYCSPNGFLSSPLLERQLSPWGTPTQNPLTVSPNTYGLRPMAKTQVVVDEAVLMAPLMIGAYSDQQHTLRARALGDWLLGTVIVIIVALIWTGATVLKQYIFWNLHFDHPFFLCYVGNSCYTLNLGFYAVARAGGCLGQSRASPDRDGAGAHEKRVLALGGPIQSAACLGAMIAPIWFMAQWTYGSGVAATSVTSSTVIAATSCAWTYVLSAIFLQEKFHWVKISGLCFCIFGNIATLAGDANQQDHLFPAGGDDSLTGDALCLLSAILYATYTTIIKKFIHKDVPITIFFGILGCVLFVGVSPIAWLYSASLSSGLNSQVLAILILNGVFDNVLSQFLWAKAVILTSPTVATVGLSLTIPLAVLSDLLRGIDLSIWSLVSALLVVMGFLAVNIGSSIDQ